MQGIQTAHPLLSYFPQLGQTPGRAPIAATSNPITTGAPGPRTIVPGSAFRPGGNNTGNVKPNKRAMVSNETVVTDILCSLWPTTNYHKTQRKGDILFARRKLERGSESVPLVSVAQLNEILRITYKQLVSAHNASQQKHSPFAQASPASEIVPQDVLRLYQESLVEGERAFVKNTEVSERIATDRRYNVLMPCSRRHILEAYNLLGIYAGDSGREAKKQLTYTVQVAGCSTYQDPWNLWGNVREGHRLFFILKRRKDEQRSRPGKPVYAEFQFVPYATNLNYPPQRATRYYDDAGHVQYGAVLRFGTVYKVPLSLPQSEEMHAKAGLVTDSEHAQALTIHQLSVTINPARVNSDLYAN